LFGQSPPASLSLLIRNLKFLFPQIRNIPYVLPQPIAVNRVARKRLVEHVRKIGTLVLPNAITQGSEQELHALHLKVRFESRGEPLRIVREGRGRRHQLLHTRLS